MGRVNIDELNNTVDAFKSTVGALSEIRAISKDVQKVSENISNTGLEVSQNMSKLTAKTEIFSKAADSFIKRSKEATDRVTDELEGQNRKIGTYLESNVEEMKSVSASFIRETEKIISSNEELGKKVQEYALSTQKSVDELRILGANNAREIREKITEMNSSVSSKLGILEKSIQDLVNEAGQVKLQNIKDHTLVIACLVTSAVAAVSAIVGLFI